MQKHRGFGVSRKKSHSSNQYNRAAHARGGLKMAKYPGILYVEKDMEAGRLKQLLNCWEDRLASLHIITSNPHVNTKHIKISKKIILLPKHLDSIAVGSGDALLYALYSIECDRFLLLFDDVAYEKEYKKAFANDENVIIVNPANEALCLCVDKNDFLDAAEAVQGGGQSEIVDIFPKIKNLQMEIME